MTQGAWPTISDHSCKVAKLPADLLKVDELFFFSSDLPLAHSRYALRSLFASSIPDRDLNPIPSLNPRHFAGLYHQTTVAGLIQVVYFVVVNEPFLTD